MTVRKTRFLQLGPLALDLIELHPVLIVILLSALQGRYALPSRPDIRVLILNRIRKG